MQSTLRIVDSNVEISEMGVTTRIEEDVVGLDIAKPGIRDLSSPARRPRTYR